MTQLSKKQRDLLTTGASSEDGNLLSDPAVGKRPYQPQSAIADLIKRGLASEVAGEDAFRAWRSKRGKHFYAIISEAGQAIAGAGQEGCASQPLNEKKSSKAPTSPRATKIAEVLVLLGTAEGATLQELTAATDWLPHTMRAALTGLRKKGHNIASTGDVGARRYRLISQEVEHGTR